MGRFLTHKDGRLKTGRVAVMVFAALLICAGGLFKANRPIDKALMAVKHVFEPQEAQPNRERHAVPRKEPPLKHDQETAIRPEEKPAAEKEKAQGRGPRTEKMDQTTKIARPAGQAVIGETNNPKTRKDQTPGFKALAARLKERFKVSADQKESRKPMNEDIGPLKPLPLGNPERKSEDKPSQEEKIDSLESLKKLATWRGDVKEKAPEPNIGLGRLSAFLERKKGEGASEAQRSRITEPELNKAKALVKPGQSLSETKPISVDRSKNSVTVGEKQYMALFRSWRETGSASKGRSKIPLRVENLRSAFEFFQMKPVAFAGGRFIDLSDGTRLPEASLAEYSLTVFRVDRPWAKWGNALKAAGIRRNEMIEVRYYMYGFIRDAIYARVNQGFEWCKEKGLIPEDTKPSDVDVLGRVYVIKREGGGRFGVFVPLSLSTGEGRIVDIDPSCFDGQADIDTLRLAGLIGNK